MPYTQKEINDTLKRFKFVAGMHIKKEHLKNYSFEAKQDFDTDNIVLKLFYRPFGEIITEIKYPQNWKEAVKEALYSRLGLDMLKKKFPVKYTVYDVTAFYPNVSLPDEKCTLTFKQNKQDGEADHETQN